MKKRYSKHKEDILNLLNNTKEVFSASNIQKNLSHINLSTIYRNLDKLLEENKIVKLKINDNTALYEINEKHQHAICNDCNKIIHITSHSDKFKKILNIPNFDIKEIEMIIRGNCTDKK